MLVTLFYLPKKYFKKFYRLFNIKLFPEIILGNEKYNKTFLVKTNITKKPIYDKANVFQYFLEI